MSIVNHHTPSKVSAINRSVEISDPFVADQSLNEPTIESIIQGWYPKKHHMNHMEPLIPPTPHWKTTPAQGGVSEWVIETSKSIGVDLVLRGTNYRVTTACSKLEGRDWPMPKFAPTI